MSMQRRRVGRTNIELSVIGLGTAQLRTLPRERAVETLTRGINLGVNWIHNAPDYGGVEPWIAQAIRESGREVMVVSHGPGPLSLLELYFEHTCRLYGTDRLALYGLGCVEHLERIGENVWGPGGMIEFLERKKAEGRLGGIYCATHGTADEIVRLVRSGVFDAVMLAYNPLGFHLFSYDGTTLGHQFDGMPDVRERVLPVAIECGVSLLVMKPLGGGLLSKGRAFPPHAWMADPAPSLPAADLLRYVLAEPGVCAVVPGVTSPEEAEEDALAGHAPIELHGDRRAAIERATVQMSRALCSRCGACEPTCSQGLPISFMFRDAYIWAYRTHASLGDDAYNYFRLHPGETLACATCTNRTCICPQGIAIPEALAKVHATVHGLAGRRQHPGPPDLLATRVSGGAYPVRVVTADVPDRLTVGTAGVASFILEHAGMHPWLAPDFATADSPAVGTGAAMGGHACVSLPLRHNVEPGQRWPVAFTLEAPSTAGTYDLRFFVAPLDECDGSWAGEPFFTTPIIVDPEPPRMIDPAPARSRVALQRPVPWTVGRVIRGVLRRARAIGSPPRRTYAAQYMEHTIPRVLQAGVTAGYRITVANTGSWTWRAHEPDGQPIGIQVLIDGALYADLALPVAEVPPGDTFSLHFAMRAPAEVGRHIIRLDLVHRQVGPFSQMGVWPLTVDVTVEPAPYRASARPTQLALKHNLWYYQPTCGIQYSRDGRPYPLFITKATGCRVWDPEGNEFLDYTMSWGATILGHADDRIQDAIRGMLDTGSLTPFPHPLEMEVAGMLSEDFPSAEMVVFGKNGSDVCTVAARLARLFTGKRMILSCGFHGWQDFGLDYFSFEGSGIPKGPDRSLYKFRFNDLTDFDRYYEQTKHDLAAIMIEPSGPGAGPELGVEPDADVAFLRTIADAARRVGALLIFDEIITGFRYRNGGSVQSATGVIPDLTCLGKALASGMPLSALVGRSDIFNRCFALTHYCPTFKGEVYSFAAARAAIEVYRKEPVADHIWSYGEALRAGIHAICGDLGLAAECKGPPFRMGLHFHEPDPVTARLKRTLYMQELLKERIITPYGMMLPSYAHDAAVMAQTLDGVRAALTVVARAERERTFHRDIEIPLL